MPNSFMELLRHCGHPKLIQHILIPHVTHGTLWRQSGKLPRLVCV